MELRGPGACSGSRCHWGGGGGPASCPLPSVVLEAGALCQLFTEHLFHVGTLYPCFWDSPRSNADRNLIGEFVAPLLRLLATLWTAACQAPLSSTIS